MQSRGSVWHIVWHTPAQRHASARSGEKGTALLDASAVLTNSYADLSLPAVASAATTTPTTTATASAAITSAATATTAAAAFCLRTRLVDVDRASADLRSI